MKLEKKILDKVYRFETKRTFVKLILKLILLAIAIVLGGYFLGILFDELVRQKTLDVFEIFKEDIEIIWEYFNDTVFIVYNEIPKITLLLAVIFSFSGLVLILTITKNFVKIRNKIRSLIKYWI